MSMSNAMNTNFITMDRKLILILIWHNTDIDFYMPLIIYHLWFVLILLWKYCAVVLFMFSSNCVYFKILLELTLNNSHIHFIFLKKEIFISWF